MPTALMTVSNKENLELLASFLDTLGWGIYATPGTQHYLNRKANVRGIGIEFVTNYPSLLGGQVKAMHPKILGGILMKESDEKQADKHFFGPIDIVVVNFYPFMDTVQSGATDAECIRHIDIGGPTLVHAAVKNSERVTVLVDPEDYQTVIDEITAHGTTLASTRQRLAFKAEAYALNYHTAVYHWLKSKMSTPVSTPNPYADLFAGGKLAKKD